MRPPRVALAAALVFVAALSGCPERSPGADASSDAPDAEVRPPPPHDVPAGSDVPLDEPAAPDVAPPVDSAGDASPDAPIRCGAGMCAPGRICCEATGGCYDPGCTDCCTRSSEDGGRDAGGIPCGATTCRADETCCPDDSCAPSGRGCLPPVIDAGPPCPCPPGTMCCPDRSCVPAGASCVPPECPPCMAGMECCTVHGAPAYGMCYDPECGSCCL